MRPYKTPGIGHSPNIGHNGGPPLDEDFEKDEDAAKLAEQSEFDALMGMTVQDILREGQKELFARLVSKCRVGTASHQELAILRNLLKDNGLTMGIPQAAPEAEQGSPLSLPTFDEGPEFA